MIDASRKSTDASFVGQRFGRLVILGIAKRKRGKIMWECVCDCGERTIVRVDHVRSGRSKSCGCLSIEVARNRSTKHGQSWPHSPEYESWARAKARCQNPNDKNFHRYGGRGITFCERWESFENFYADMGDKPGRNYSIERKDNSKGYEPNNCKWATAIEQANNRSNNRVVVFDGQTKTLAQWAKHTGIQSRTLWQRLHLGWSPERALLTPVRALAPAHP